MEAFALLSWSLGVQLGVDILVAVFFLILARTVRLNEATHWAFAWSAQAIAIACGFGLTFTIGPEPGFLAPIPGHLLLGGFLAAKTAYVLLVSRGIRMHTDPTFAPLVPMRGLIGLGLVWGVAASPLVHDPRPLLPLQWLVVSSVLCASAIRALRRSPGRAPLLVGILLGEGLFFGGYGVLTLPLLWGGVSPLSFFFSYSSFLDAGCDLLLALAGVLALERTRARHLEDLNQRLLESHEQLRQLADRDPLTGLANRRALRDVLDLMGPTVAAFLFLDIDGFKDTNDRFGHAAGDACLIRVAGELLHAFRPHDYVFRWGGDEFLVVAPGLDAEGATARIRSVRAELGHRRSGHVPCSVSVGVAWLEKGERPDEVLRRADEAMYADKKQRALTM